jgi:hypothetical protein
VSPMTYAEQSYSSSRRARSPVSPIEPSYQSYSSRRHREPAVPSSSYGRNPYEMPDFSRAPRRDYDYLDALDSSRRGASRRYDGTPSRSSSRRGVSPEPQGYGGVDLSSLGGGYDPYASGYGYGGGYGGGYQTREYRPSGR